MLIKLSLFLDDKSRYKICFFPGLYWIILCALGVQCTPFRGPLRACVSVFLFSSLHPHLAILHLVSSLVILS